MRITTRSRRSRPEIPPDWEISASGGPRPFTSWVTYRLPDQSYYEWGSRRHRKTSGPRLGYADRAGLRASADAEEHSTRSPWLRFWAPHRLAWWVAIIFMAGSALFVAGAAGSLAPEAFGSQHTMSVFAETCYFFGATLYTISIYAQLLESINADDRIDTGRKSYAPARFRWFGLELTKLDFLVPFVLFLGSLVFNYETVFALGSSLDVLPKLGLWLTSLVGSLLFLASGLLQFIEAGHGYLSFAPRNVSWWIGLLFILGSIGFVIGTLPGLDTPGFPTNESGPGAQIVKIGFLLGGLAYFIGSYLMLPELFTDLRPRRRSA